MIGSRGTSSPSSILKDKRSATKCTSNFRATIERVSGLQAPASGPSPPAMSIVGRKMRPRYCSVRKALGGKVASEKRRDLFTSSNECRVNPTRGASPAGPLAIQLTGRRFSSPMVKTHSLHFLPHNTSSSTDPPENRFRPQSFLRAQYPNWPR